ncbi:MAG: carboxypeptidase-like regulatory domain-containing protein [Archangium sp.]
MRLAWLVGLVLTTGCFDLTVPPPLVAGPGTVRATLLVARPGRTGLVPASGATLRWSLSSEIATADDEGNVLLGGLLSSEGVLRFATAEGLERVVDVRLAKVGFGRDVNLGTLVLGRTATVTGRVRRADRPSTTSGHADIAVFLPESPVVTTTGDTGDFELNGLPEGDLSISFFAAGYEASSTRLTVRAGERVVLGEVQLQRSTTPQMSDVGCVIKTTTGVTLPGAKVSVANATSTFELNGSDGRYTRTGVPSGLYVLTARADGYRPLQLDNVLVFPGNAELGTFTLGSGGDARPDGGVTGGDGGLVLRGTFTALPAPAEEASGLRLRHSAIGFRTRVCSGSLCVSGEVTP